MAPQREINNVLGWSRAFQLYASIYTKKYSIEGSGIFQYMSIIQSLAHKGQNWLLYDQKFRQLRAKSQLPWGRLHVQTHLFISLSRPKFQKCKSQGLSQGRLRQHLIIWPSSSRVYHLLVLGLFFVQDTAEHTNDMAIATGPTAQESTNVRYVTDSMPDPHVPGHPNKATLVSSTKENQNLSLILPTPIKVKVLDSYLEGYNPEDRNFIVNGFSKGFPLGVEGFVPPSISPNHQSALAHGEFIDDNLKRGSL